MNEKPTIRFGKNILLAGALLLSCFLYSCGASEVEIPDSKLKYEKVLGQVVDEEGNSRFPKAESTDVTVLGWRCSLSSQSPLFQWIR